jgi:hypothetical protein
MPIAVCAIVRNEVTYLPEWIAYQKSIGFDRIIIYDNDSTDLSVRLLPRLATLGYIDYHPWPDRAGVNRQVSAYEHAVSHYKHDIDWIAFFDIDEFIVLHRDESVAQLMQDYREFAGLAVNWKLFGSSGHETRHKGLVIERFDRCAERNAPPNRCVKTIANPNRIRRCNVHICYPRVTTIVDENRNDVMKTLLRDGIHERISHERVQLNHYIVRSREEWLRKKARGHGAKTPEQKYDYRDEFFQAHDRNEQVDPAALRYASLVRAELAVMGASLTRTGFGAGWRELASYF